MTVQIRSGFYWPAFYVLAGESTPQIVGVPAPLLQAAADPHTFSYTLPSSVVNGLIVAAYTDDDETFTGCSWNVVGDVLQTMTPLTPQANGVTRCQLFTLFEPHFGDAGEGTISLDVAAALGGVGILPIAISGWGGTPAVEVGQSGSGTSLPVLTLTGITPNTLIIHAVCLGSATVSVTFVASGEVSLVNVDCNPTAGLRMGAAWKMNSVGTTATVDAAVSATTRFADVAAAFPGSVALATIALIGADAAESGSSAEGIIPTSLNPFIWPSGIVAGDLMLLMVSAHWHSTATVTTGPPAGFTEVGSVVTSNDVVGTPRNCRMWIYQKIAAGTESGTAETLNTGANSEGAAGVVLRNADIIEASGSLVGGSDSDPRPTAPTLTALGANRWAVMFWAQSEDSTGANDVPPPGTVNTETWTEGSGANYTLRAFFTTSFSDDRMGGVLTAAMASGETISGKRPIAPTGTDAYSRGWVARGLVIRPKVL